MKNVSHRIFTMARYLSKKTYVNYLALSVVFVTAFTVFYLLCRKSPYMLDDYYLMYVNKGAGLFSVNFDEAVRVSGFDDLITSALNIYNNWGGRFFWTILIQSLLIFDKSLYDVLNSVMFVLLIVLLVKHISPAKRFNLLLTVIVATATWLCAPAAGQTFFIAAISTTYLWFSVILLLLLLPYRIFSLSNGYSGNKHLLSIAIFILGGVACNTNANTAAAVIMLELIFLWMIYKRHNKLPLWAVCGILGSVCGYALMLCSPGIAVRIVNENHPYHGFFYKFSVQSAYIIDTVPVLLAAIFFMAWFVWFSRRSLKHFVDNSSVFYLLAAFSSCYIMVLSPYSPSRTMFGPFVFLLITAGILFEKYSLILGTYRFKVPFSMAICVVALGSYLYAYRDISFTSSLHN